LTETIQSWKNSKSMRTKKMYVPNVYDEPVTFKVLVKDAEDLSAPQRQVRDSAAVCAHGHPQGGDHHRDGLLLEESSGTLKINSWS